jgi:hypothetical protein
MGRAASQHVGLSWGRLAGRPALACIGSVRLAVSRRGVISWLHRPDLQEAAQ